VILVLRAELFEGDDTGTRLQARIDAGEKPFAAWVIDLGRIEEDRADLLRRCLHPAMNVLARPIEQAIDSFQK